MKRTTVLVAMSGGVDSSVAAAMLVEAGYRVIGATMKTFCYSGTPASARSCCGLDGIADARMVAHRLGIPHYVFDLEEGFTRDVIDDFVNEYVAGRTPNPCVRCNSRTKIPDLLRRGQLLGADAVATGHFARLQPAPPGPPRLLRGVDREKDQSYFLWEVPSEVLSRLHFPVGELSKSEVRERARELALVTADKPESQEICFVPTGDYGDLLEQRLGAEHPALTPGELVDPAGRVVGSHGGYARYTVGQRRGLGGGFGRRLYVLGLRPERNQVVVGDRSDLDRTEVALEELNWLAAPPLAGEEVLVQLRHRAPAVPALVRGRPSDRLDLELGTPQKAVTPGQSGAVYRGEVLIGGGRIR